RVVRAHRLRELPPEQLAVVAAQLLRILADHLEVHHRIGHQGSLLAAEAAACCLGLTAEATTALRTRPSLLGISSLAARATGSKRGERAHAQAQTSLFGGALAIAALITIAPFAVPSASARRTPGPP